MRNRYLLILNNNYTGFKFVFELLNTTDDPNFYKFEIDSSALPENFYYGEYDFYLIRCELEYDITFSKNLIDSQIKVVDVEGNTHSFLLRDLPCESGILSFEPNSKESPYEKIDTDNDYVTVDMV